MLKKCTVSSYSVANHIFKNRAQYIVNINDALTIQFIFQVHA